MIILISVLLCVAAYRVGYLKGKQRKELDSDPCQAILALKRRVEDTGISKFGKNNPNQTDYEKGYLLFLDHFENSVEEELEAIKEALHGAA